MTRWRWMAGSLAVALALATRAGAQDCAQFQDSNIPVPNQGSNLVPKVSAGIVALSSELRMNADGAPTAYDPGNNGISHFCNAFVAWDAARSQCLTADHASDWVQKCRAAHDAALAQGFAGEAKLCTFGIRATGGERRGSFLVGGKPVVQGPDEAAPGNYVSPTGFTVPGASDPDRQSTYIDSTAIPYVVVPRTWAARDTAQSGLGIKGLDLVYVQHPELNGGKGAFAVVGDIGPAKEFGEGSIALYQMLRYGRVVGQKLDDGTLAKPFALKDGKVRLRGGLSEGVRFLFLKNTAGEVRQLSGAGFTNEAIQALGERLLAQLGGPSIVDCAAD